MINEKCTDMGKMTFNLDEAVDASKYGKLSLEMSCSVPYVMTDRKKDTLEVILTSGGKEGGYKITLKYYDIYGDRQRINLDLKKLVCTDKTVDLSDIDTISFVWKNASGQKAANFYFSSMEFTEKKTPLILYGDTDMDGKISSSDALLVLQNVVGLADFDEQTGIIADVDGDGSISSSDALLILQKTVGLIDAFPCEKKN